MASHNAKLAAKKVSETIRSGKKVNLGKILKENGYSESTSKHPDLVTKTKSFQEVIKPVVDEMDRLRTKIVTEMHSKDLTKVKFMDLSFALKNTTHDIQLIRGKSTENITLNDYANKTDSELRAIAEGSNEGVSLEGASEEEST